MKPIWRVFRYLKFYPKEIVLNVVFNAMAVVFNLFSFVLIVPVIELFFGGTQVGSEAPKFAFNREALTDWAMWHLHSYEQSVGITRCLLLVAAGYLLCSLLYNLCRYMGLYFLSPIRNGVLHRLRDDIYHKITILPLSFFSTHKKGDIISRLSSDLADIEWSIVSTLQSLIKDPINVIVFVATLVFIDWKLFLLFLLVLPPSVWLIGKIGKSLKRNSLRGQTELGDMMSTYKETLDNMEVIRAYDRERYRQQQFDKVNQSYSRRMMRVAARKELSSPLSEILGTIGLTAILILGGYAVVRGELVASVFILFVIVFARLIPPLQAIVKAYSSLQKGSASAQRIFEILDAEERIVEAADAIPLAGFTDSIVYHNVSFRYDPQEPTPAESEPVSTLKEINLTIRKGQKVAIVGPSGAGKTTMVDLLPRFYDCTEGYISIDGTPIKQLVINSLRKNIGVVSQNCILFNDTIANNIAFGLTNISIDQIRAAAKMANADEFITQFPLGYDTPVGDKGGTLSGGQRQRISIARAILRHPPILILDEATSALDNESQHLVQQALDSMMDDCTSIVIAHRLSTIENADLIVVMDEGRIVEQGTHQELMQQKGLYHHLVELQSFK